MRSNDAISIIVPTLNEAANIALLIPRIAASLKPAGITYEIIVVDDHSVDKTIETVAKLARKYPVRCELKNGQRGKSFSLIQGFNSARYATICMIDADLQYPPEAILPMFDLIRYHQADIVITDRQNHQTSRMRQLTTRTYNLLFVRLLFGFDYDTQSGLKLFKKEVFETISINPKQWSFDLEFIVRALEKNYRILRYSIPFAARQNGTAKIHLMSSSFELALSSLQLSFNSSKKELRQAYKSNARRSKPVSGSRT